jgi:RNA polymerase sigma factor (sigma-70 family)
MLTQSIVSDQQLVSAYIQGNEQSLEILIERHKSKVFNYIMSFVKNRDIADDLFQDIFIKAITTLKKGGYNEEGKFLPWLMRIAHNMIIDHFRREKRMPMVGKTETFDIFDVLGDTDPNVEEAIVFETINQDVKKLIDYLPEDQKEVLNLRLFCNLSFKDIAEETGVSINTALGRMRYALINMRKLVEENDIKLTY